MRGNGLQKPFHPTQVGTWILRPTLLIQFLLFAAPILPLAASIPCTVCVFACGAVTAHFTYRCCSIDPMDERLRRDPDRQNGGTVGEIRPSGGREDDEDVKHCWVCRVDVHESSTHCQFCDKCVENFDHHCHYLNTCIGRANYEFFFRSLGSVLTMEIVRGGVLAGLVISFFTQYADEINGGLGGTTLERSNSWFGADAGLIVAIVNSIFLAVDMTCIVLLVQLFSLHIRLRQKGITTYTYIVDARNNKQERGRERIELERRRTSAVRQAERDGNRAKKWRLVAAGCHPRAGEATCGPCDPPGREEGDGGRRTPSPRAEGVRDEGNEVRDRAADGGSRDRPADAESEEEDAEECAGSTPKGEEENDFVPSVNGPNDIHVESDEKSVEMSAPRAATERRRSQQKHEEESSGHGSTSNGNGEQKAESLQT